MCQALYCVATVDANRDESYQFLRELYRTSMGGKTET